MKKKTKLTKTVDIGGLAVGLVSDHFGCHPPASNATSKMSAKTGGEGEASLTTRCFKVGSGLRDSTQRKMSPSNRTPVER